MSGNRNNSIRRKKNTVTELSRYDRKILSKYTGYCSNFIESNTARPDIFKDEENKKADMVKK